MAQHAKKVEKRRRNAVKPGAEMPNRPSSSRETRHTPPGETPGQRFTARLTHREAVRGALEHEGKLPSRETGGQSRHNVFSHHSAEDPNRPYALHLVQTLKTQHASPPVSSTQTHGQSPQAPATAAVTHVPKHASRPRLQWAMRLIQTL
jgi:hypothetical protein